MTIWEVVGGWAVNASDSAGLGQVCATGRAMRWGVGARGRTPMIRPQTAQTRFQVGTKAGERHGRPALQPTPRSVRTSAMVPNECGVTMRSTPVRSGLRAELLRVRFR